MLLPWVRLETIVVSDIKERLSPNIAPHITDAAIKFGLMPLLTAILKAIGAIATIDPTEVPAEKERKQVTKNIPETIQLGLIYLIPKFATVSTQPISLQREEKVSKA